jgi:hypothetical protein
MMRPTGTGRLRRSLLNAAALGTLFAAALVANHRLAGPSPIVWIDTFRDETEVRQCLVEDSCTLVGLQTSIAGQFHAVAWLELRTLLAWLGVGLDGAHLVVQVLNALAVVLVFQLATRLGGPLAGAAAAWIFMDRIEALVQVAALFNSGLLVFLGAVFVLACTAVVERPGVVSVALAALVGAVMANVHLACALTGASVVWVGLTAPRRRVLLAGFGAALFALATFAMAPPGWLHNLVSLGAERAARVGPPAVTIVANDAMVSWALFALCAWVASLASRAPVWAEYRRRSQGAIAVMVPFLAAFFVAPRFGLLPESRYLLHLKAACAVAAALPLAVVAGATLRAVSARLLVSVEWISPFALALAIALQGPLGIAGSLSVAEDQRPPTIADLEAVARILHEEHGWDATRMAENLKTPYGVALLTGLRQTTAAGDGASGVAANVGSSALFMVLAADELPDPLPSNWTVVRRSARSAAVLVLLQSRIDWSEFEVCQREGDSPPQCGESGWRFDGAASIVVPNMPASDRPWRGTLELSLPLRSAGAGGAGAVFMPRMRTVCAGRITSLPVAGAAVDSDGRHATIPASELAPAGPSVIKLEWDIGAPECSGLAYDGGPPFFIEGDAATVRLVEAILRKREGRSS